MSRSYIKLHHKDKVTEWEVLEGLIEQLVNTYLDDDYESHSNCQIAIARIGFLYDWDVDEISQFIFRLSELTKDDALKRLMVLINIQIANVSIQKLSEKENANNS